MYLVYLDSRNLKQAKITWGEKPQACHSIWVAASSRPGKQPNFPEWNPSKARHGSSVRNIRAGGCGGTNNSLRRPDGDGAWVGNNRQNHRLWRESFEMVVWSSAGSHGQHILFGHRQVVDLQQWFGRNLPVLNGPVINELNSINTNILVTDKVNMSIGAYWLGQHWRRI